MNRSDVRTQLSQSKENFNAHYNYILKAYPELAWRMRKMDQAVTHFEDVIEFLLEENKENDLTLRETTREAGQLIQATIDRLDLNTYETL